MTQKRKEKTPPEACTTCQSVAELQGLIDAPIKCEFNLDGRKLAVELVRLKPSVLELVRAIPREATPPWSEGRKEYDYLNQKFQENRERLTLTARAVALYAGCPIIAQARPGLVKREEIFGHVQGLFSEIILELLYTTLTREGVSLEERVNFISTPDSAPN